MKTVSTFKLMLFTISGLISVLIPLSLWSLWIHCFNAQGNQADRVAMYHSFFPEFLNGHYTISLISILLCLAGIILPLIFIGKKSMLLKTISVIIAFAGGLTGLLTLFTLM